MPNIFYPTYEILPTDGFTNSWELNATPDTDSLLLMFNGLLQKPGADYVLVGQLVTMVATPASGDAVIAYYTAQPSVLLPVPLPPPPGKREAISVALFNLLSQNSNLAYYCKTITRIPQIWSAVPEAERPFLLLFKGGPETEAFIQPQQGHIGLTKYRFNYNLWLYLTADPTGQTVAETTINNIADSIDNAMKTTLSGQTAYGERQTLGGLVNNAWIEGGSEWGREFEDTNITVFWRIAVETGI